MTSNKLNTQDPGWNDPPTFTYDQANAIQASAVKKGTLLNKRVPFPLSSKATTTHIDPTLPPKPMDVNAAGPPKCPVVAQTSSTPQIKQEDKTECSDDLDAQQMLKVVLENLKSVSSYEQNGDIWKRIEVMEQMWNEDKLSHTVKSRIYSLTKALKNGETEAADNIQKGLMVDSAGQCSTWISGLRHVILNMSTTQKTEEVSLPFDSTDK